MVAAELQALGCNKDTIVGTVFENRLEFPVIITGAMLTGAIVTFFNPDHAAGKQIEFTTVHECMSGDFYARSL